MHMCCLQNYKEVCRNIAYDCKTDTISASCANRRSSYETHGVPSDAVFLDLSYPGASECSSNIGVNIYAHVNYSLECVDN